MLQEVGSHLPVCLVPVAVRLPGTAESLKGLLDLELGLRCAFQGKRDDLGPLWAHQEFLWVQNCGIVTAPACNLGLKSHLSRADCHVHYL
jgi:hypothetical protein